MYSVICLLWSMFYRIQAHQEHHELVYELRIRNECLEIYKRDKVYYKILTQKISIFNLWNAVANAYIKLKSKYRIQRRFQYH